MDFARTFRAAIATLFVAACSSSTPGTQAPPDGGQSPDGGPSTNGNTVTKVFDSAVNRDLDVLLMVDDSQNMLPAQLRLKDSVAAFIRQLAALPAGLPRLHLAVISSDLGAGPTAPSASCRVGGDQGQFQVMPRVAGCSTGLDAGQHFLSSIDGVNNFTGDLASALSCIVPLGDSGCGYEHQFASMLRALEPGQPASNHDFLRPSAHLAIVFLTNEDDCSAPPDSDLFNTSSTLVSDPLGPLTSFRCNEFGHLCNGMKPPRTPATLTGCTSAEDGRLLKVSDVIARTRALKGGDDSKIIIAAIAGPDSPYEVKLVPGTSATGVMQQQPEIAHSCLKDDADFADPSVRIKQWVDAFKGSFATICDSSFDLAMSRIAAQIATAMGPECFPGRLVDTDLDPRAPGVQPNCTVTDILVDDKGVKTETPVPSCTASAGAMPCWALATDQTACSRFGGTSIVVARHDRPATLSTRVTCDVCKPGTPTRGCS